MNGEQGYVVDSSSDLEVEHDAVAQRQPRVAQWDLVSLVVLAMIALGAAWPMLARADGPAFDRPGIAFSPTTLPAGSFAWEQGLPDYQRDRDAGVTQSAYAANARLRFAFGDRWEAQLAVPLFEQADTSGTGRHLTAAGFGDLGLALKFGLTSGEGRVNAAALATVSFPTGGKDLGNGAAQYSLGTTIGWSVTENQSLAFYANVDILEGRATWSVSPNWSFALGDTVGGYLEAGYQMPPNGDPSNEVAGGGLTWLVRPTVQLDVYGLAGLTRRSTDLAAGCGVSVFVP